VNATSVSDECRLVTIVYYVSCSVRGIFANDRRYKYLDNFVKKMETEQMTPTWLIFRDEMNKKIRTKLEEKTCVPRLEL
jgi:hypothetical protein